MEGGYKIRNQEGIHFVTYTVVNWIDVFTRNEYKEIIIDSLKYCQQHKKMIIYGYVLMTNHIHLIIRAENADLSNLIRDFKSFTSKKLIEEIKEINESRKDWMLVMFEKAGQKNKRNLKYQFWTHNNHPEELESNKFLDQKLEYIHQNPKKAGFVSKPEDYLYSSAINYTGEKGLINIELID